MSAQMIAAGSSTSVDSEGFSLFSFKGVNLRLNYIFLKGGNKAPDAMSSLEAKAASLAKQTLAKNNVINNKDRDIKFIK